ncbi:DUF4337 domain-containing protein [Naasia lichenicola]|uniref:DUF4337 domain-containing protein n=1 Tax=Naasia lichenicola TaxID=2565933 RepID=A0A4S4FQC5_9MICO|nr:DUF4337 domain-containing protein [Naasia lichenicola]
MSNSVLLLLGLVALVVGAVWVGQGLNLIPGSFMTGNRMWFFIGIVVGLAGIVMLVLAGRRLATGRRSG